MKTTDKKQQWIDETISKIRQCDAATENQLSGKIDTDGRMLNELTYDELAEELDYYYEDRLSYYDEE